MASVVTPQRSRTLIVQEEQRAPPTTAMPLVLKGPVGSSSRAWTGERLSHGVANQPRMARLIRHTISAGAHVSIARATRVG